MPFVQIVIGGNQLYLFRDIYTDISPTKLEKYQKEKELVEKIANTLVF